MLWKIVKTTSRESWLIPSCWSLHSTISRRKSSMWCLKVKMLSGRNDQKYETLKATTICFRRSLGKLAPVIINSVLNSSDMIFRLVTLKLRGWLLQNYFPFQLWYLDPRFRYLYSDSTGRGRPNNSHWAWKKTFQVDIIMHQNIEFWICQAQGQTWNVTSKLM